MILTKLKPFFVFAAFDLGAVAWPFAVFCPGSITRPFDSAAIVYSMQLNGMW